MNGGGGAAAGHERILVAAEIAAFLCRMRVASGAVADAKEMAATPIQKAYQDLQNQVGWKEAQLVKWCQTAVGMAPSRWID